MNNLILLPIFLLVLFFLVIWFVWLSQRRGVSSVPGQPQPYFPSPIFRGADDDLSGSLMTCSIDMLGPYASLTVCSADCNPSIPSGRYKLAVTIQNTLYYLKVTESPDWKLPPNVLVSSIPPVNQGTWAIEEIVWVYDATNRTLQRNDNKHHLHSIWGIAPDPSKTSAVATNDDLGWVLTKKNHIAWKGTKTLCVGVLSGSTTMPVSLVTIAQATIDPSLVATWSFIEVPA